MKDLTASFSVPGVEHFHVVDGPSTTLEEMGSRCEVAYELVEVTWLVRDSSKSIPCGFIVIRSRWRTGRKLWFE